MDHAAKARTDRRAQHIAHHRRLQAGGVGIDQEENALLGQKLRGQLHQRVNRILQLPDLSLRPAPIGRRVHDDRIVGIAAADLPLHKLRAVIHQPADRCVLEPRGLGIFLRPLHHALGGIHMRHLGTGCCRCQCSTAGIGKEVQHLHRPVDPGTAPPCRFRQNAVGKPVPVRRLLRKKSGMLKSKGLKMEGQGALTHRKLCKLRIYRRDRAVGIPECRVQGGASLFRTSQHIRDVPLLRKIKELPLTAALAGAVVMPIQPLPVRIPKRCLPDHLRIRPAQDIFPPTLELIAAAGINDLIVLPMVCYKHKAPIVRR